MIFFFIRINYDSKVREKEIEEALKEKEEVDMGGKVMMGTTQQEGPKEVVVVPSNKEYIRAIEMDEVPEKVLEIGGSSRMLEEGEIVDIKGRESFPFLQGIQDLLRTPMRNMVIEEVCGGLEDK